MWWVPRVPFLPFPPGGPEQESATFLRLLPASHHASASPMSAVSLWSFSFSPAIGLRGPHGSSSLVFSLDFLLLQSIPENPGV